MKKVSTFVSLKQSNASLRCIPIKGHLILKLSALNINMNNFTICYTFLNIKSNFHVYHNHNYLSRSDVRSTVPLYYYLYHKKMSTSIICLHNIWTHLSINMLQHSIRMNPLSAINRHWFMWVITKNTFPHNCALSNDPMHIL